MSLPEDLVLPGAGWRLAGAQMEGRVGHRGDGAAKVAEAYYRGVRDEAGADNSRGAPRALRVAQRCAGGPTSCRSDGIGNG